MSFRPTSDTLDPAQPTVEDSTRRGFLHTFVGLLAGSATAAWGVVLARVVVGRSLAPRTPLWIRGARLHELETNIPTAVTLRIARRDGYLETVDQQVVFLTRSETQEVRALSSSCAHLGCSVSFNRERQQFLCPCHEGVFALDGTVVSGPPPRPLEPLPVRVENSRIFVQV